MADGSGTSSTGPRTAPAPDRPATPPAILELARALARQLAREHDALEHPDRQPRAVERP